MQFGTTAYLQYGDFNWVVENGVNCDYMNQGFRCAMNYHHKLY